MRFLQYLSCNSLSPSIVSKEFKLERHFLLLDRSGAFLVKHSFFQKSESGVEESMNPLGSFLSYALLDLGEYSIDLVLLSHYYILSISFSWHREQHHLLLEGGLVLHWILQNYRHSCLFEWVISSRRLC